MRGNLRKLLGRLRWAAADRYRELFIDESDRHRLERALQRLHDVAWRHPQAPHGKWIVFFSLRPWFTFLAHEGVLAARFRQQGHHVSYYTCRNDLAFCMAHNVNLPEEYRTCREGRCLLKDKWIDARYPTRHLGPMSESAAAQCRVIDELPLEACRAYAWRDVKIGDLCAPSVIWYLRRTRFDERDADIWRSFLKSAVHVLDCFEPFLEETRPDVVVCVMGAFFTEAVALEVCRRQGVRTVTYGVSAGSRLNIGHNRSIWASRELDREDLDAIELRSDIEARGRKLLDQWNRSGGYAGYLLWRGNRKARNDIYQVLGEDRRPFAVAFTNTTYETAISHKQRIFADQFEWSAFLVDYFRSHPEYRLVIRVHPAERVTDEWRVQEWFMDRIGEHVKEWPSNVTLVPPESPVSSYKLADAARVGLTYVSFIGVEMVYRGLPVITAGLSHYDNRGFTHDPVSREGYLVELERHMKSRLAVSPAQRAALIRYVSWLMYIRRIGFEPIEQGRRESYLKPRKIRPRQVFSGKLKGFESVCSLILDGREWWTIEEMVKAGTARRVSR